MTSEEEFLASLRETFLDELGDTLDQIESAFLGLERNPGSKDIINEIFRYFHNVKGSSKTVGLTHLSHFAHTAENLLSKLRNDELSLTGDMTDCLLQCSDLMRDYNEGLQNDQENVGPMEAHEKRLAEFLDAPVEESSDAGFGVFSDEEISNGRTPDSSASPPSIEQDEIKNDQQAEASESVQEASAPESVVENPEQGNEEPNEKKTERKGPKKEREEFIKVSMTKINQILDLFGEQVILQSALDHSIESHVDDSDFISKSVGQLKKITQDLQHSMVTLRMISLENLFNRMERTVRDVSRLTGKKINFKTVGQNAELDKTIVDALLDPLMHMVRNAVDHGIESVEERIEQQKDPEGTVTLMAQRVGGAFEISITDDGKGLDQEKLLQKAIERGVVSKGAKLSEDQINELIFASGLSTRDEASEISGRGVGMDVVRSQIRRLKGVCYITTRLGKGTRFVIRVPLSLAMFNGTVVTINGQRYVVPNSDFTEAITLKYKDHEIRARNDQVIRLGERVLRVIDLRKNLKLQKMIASKREKEYTDKVLAIVAEQDGREYALLVSDILSQEQIVLKELGPEGKQIRGASGGTILGDGRVALVLDVGAIIKRDRIESNRRAA